MSDEREGIGVIVIRFKVTCQPDRVGELQAAFAAVLEPSRALAGVLAFDVAQAVEDPSVFIATEVFADATARETQESLPEVANVMAILKGGALAGPPEVSVYTAAIAE